MCYTGFGIMCPLMITKGCIMDKTYYVYMHRNKITGEVYVGRTRLPQNERFRTDGSGYKLCKKFYPAITKYGWDNFEHTILETGLTKEEANAAEIKYIAMYDSFNNGYNNTIGGDGGGMRGKKQTEHSKHKSSISHMGEKNSMYGRHHTQETKKLLSDLAKKRPHKRHSEETKRKIATSHIGFRHTEETKAKISLNRTGIKMPQQARQALSIRLKEKFANTKPKRDEKGRFIKG